MPFYDGSELNEVYLQAKQKGYGFMASNIAEPNILIGLLEAARATNSDLVLQLSNSAATFAGGGDAIAGLRIMSNYVRTLAEGYDIGVFLNLDHIKHKNLEFIKTAIQEQLASSIMIDASKEPFEKNVEITQKVVGLASNQNVLIEGELGKIKGVEDEQTASDEAFYTAPDEAVEFVERTGLDLLAVSVGTQHGVSKGKDIELRTDLTKKINNTLKSEGYDIPLVLHGSSGLMEDQIKEMLNYGICKLNKDTRYQYEYARTAIDYYLEHKDSIIPPDDVNDDREGFFSESKWNPIKSDFDPRVVSREIRSEVERTAARLFKQAGSTDHSLYT